VTSGDSSRPATDRVWATRPAIDVARLRQRWAEDRFVRPAEVDPRRLVDQRRIVSTVRGSEVVSDPTNVLALEAAHRRRSSQDVHLAAHHLSAWQTLRGDTLGPGVSLITYSTFGDRGLAERIADSLGPEVSELQPENEPMSGGGYYAGLRFKIMARTVDGLLEIGDGGLTDWTAGLAADAKERCLISCVSTERWLGLIS
jgi:hypothetical protein